MTNFTINTIFGSAIVLIIVIFLLSVVKAYLSFAPWVPSFKRDLKRVFKLADLKPGEIFYDLGCGTGKVAAYAAANYQVKAIGLELVLPFYLICKIRQLFGGNKKLIIKYKNLFKENLRLADVVYIFGVPKTINGKLKEKLAEELKPGARVISYAFKINDWTPAAIDKPGEKDLPIFLYVR